MTVADVHFLLPQFADDTVVFISYDLSELQVVVETFEHIEENTGLKEENTGLKINYDKTTIYRVGSLKNSDAKLYTNKEFTWSDGDSDLLGIEVANGQQMAKSFDLCINKMEQVCATWYL